MKLRLNDLRNFLEVARSSTMREAAQRLAITPPALSESIKRLEQDVKGPLFYRTRAGISLTPMGQSVHLKAKSAWASLSEIESIHDPQGRFGDRRILLGCHPLVASYILPEALRRLGVQWPDYKIELRHERSGSIQTEIQRGRIDLGIVINPVASPDLVLRRLGSDQFGVWKAKRGRTDQVFCDLELHQTQAILRRWKQAPANPTPTSSLELAARLAGQGLGFAILPRRAVRLLKAPLELVDLSPLVDDVIAILYRPEFGKSEVGRALIDALRSSFDN